MFDFVFELFPLVSLLDFWWVPLIFVFGMFFDVPVVKKYRINKFNLLTASFKLPKSVYHPFKNVTLRSAQGTFTIKKILVSVYGVFVMEIKDMRGMIVGSELQAIWQKTTYKDKQKFPNPLHKNTQNKHFIESLLNISPESVHSVVVFLGNTEIRTTMPANVTFDAEYITYIKSFTEQVLTQEQVMDIIQKISAIQIVPELKTATITEETVADASSFPVRKLTRLQK